jgi:hypothetical protein
VRLSSEHIQEKRQAGKTKDGQPILYVLTKGGLHAFFVKSGDGIESIGAAPHRAVAEWIAEKKSPGLEWDQKFKDDLGKSQGITFGQARGLVFAPVPEHPVPDNGAYLVYCPRDRVVDVLSEDEIRDCLAKGEHASSFVRPMNLAEPVDLLAHHPRFQGVRRGR